MATTTATLLGTSNMRTSSRQTRTNPPRTSRIVGSSLRQNSLLSNPLAEPATSNVASNINPAINHFTDAITALPREYRRHTSLLKEVDAKAWAPEEKLRSLLTACIASKPPRPAATSAQSTEDSASNVLEPQIQPSAGNSVASFPLDNASQLSAASLDPANLPRRHLFYNLRCNLTEMMVTMDEKNHVINNANEDLARHMRRIETIFPHLASEVSEEARLGSMTHWAYNENRAPTKAAGHSSRREAAASLAIMHDTEIASRSEARREALMQRKQRQQQVDSDFDDTRNVAKRTNGNGKVRRIGEIAAEAAGLGISNAGPSSKKKKGEKVTANPMESLSGGQPMSREPSQQEATKKRKAPTSAPAPAKKRHVDPNVSPIAANPYFRLAGNISASNSPALASSPIVGTFGKDAPRASPKPSSVRPQSSRARQNSAQTNDGAKGRLAPIVTTKNGLGVSASTPELQKVAAMTGKTTGEVKTNMKESTTNRGDRLVEEDTASANGDTTLRGGILLERSSSKLGSLKREAEDESMSKAGLSPRLTQSLLANERPSRGRSSKTATPLVGTFAEAGEGFDRMNGNGKAKRPQPRSRMKDQLQDSLSPTGLPVKRSHKKGAGLAAQQAALQEKLKAQAVEDATSSAAENQADDESDLDDAVNGEEELYCVCNGVSYGEMVGCDGKDCPTEWFHLECVGLDKAPGKNTKWYCDDCKEKLRGRNGSISRNGR